VLFKLGKVEEAVPHLEKAAQKPSGGDGTIWDHLGDAYERLGKHDQAVDAWQKALKEAEAEKHPDVKLLERLKLKLGQQKPDAPKSPQRGNP
jgi:tetratricopeptide (TPR) repeat protein